MVFRAPLAQYSKMALKEFHRQYPEVSLLDDDIWLKFGSIVMQRRPIRLGILTISLAALAAMPTEAKVFECVISEKYVCDSGRGCGQVHNDIVVKLDLTRQTYSRCDPKRCDIFDVRFTEAGAYAVIDVPGRGMLAKFSNDGSDFVEVATIESQAVISFGSCK